MATSVQALFTERILSVWGLLELSTLAFIIYLSVDYAVKRQGEVIKFFLIQAFRGIGLLWVLMRAGGLGVNGGWTVWGVAILVLKIGAVPLHTWFLTLRRNIGWEMVYLFLTLQKVIPLHLMRILNSRIVWAVVFLSWGVGSLRRLRTKRVKKLFIFSSLFFIGVLLGVALRRVLWLKFLLVYSVIRFPLFCWIKEEANLKGGDRLTSYSGLFQTAIWLRFLNLGGIPPFPGFLLKVRIVAWLWPSTFLIFRFLGFSLLIIYIYLRLSFLALLRKGPLKERGRLASHLVFTLTLQLGGSLILMVLFMGVNT